MLEHWKTTKKIRFVVTSCQLTSWLSLNFYYSHFLKQIYILPNNPDKFCICIIFIFIGGNANCKAALVWWYPPSIDTLGSCQVSQDLFEGYTQQCYGISLVWYHTTECVSTTWEVPRHMNVTQKRKYVFSADSNQTGMAGGGYGTSKARNLNPLVVYGDCHSWGRYKSNLKRK